MKSTALIIAVAVHIVTEFSPITALNPRSDPSRFRIYDIEPPLSAPCDLCEGPDKALWGIDLLRAAVFSLDPPTGHVKSYDIPFTLPALNFTLPPAVGKLAGRLEFGCAIRPGLDGNIYFLLGFRGQLGRINPTDKVVKVLTPLNPFGNLEPFNDLTSSPDGIYFTLTTANKIAFFSFATENVTYYTPPTPNSLPLAVYYAFTDGCVYFTQVAAFKIGMLNPRTGKITEFFVGISGAEIRVEQPFPDGPHPYLWVPTGLLNGVARFNPNNGRIKNFQNPVPGGLTSEDTIDHCGIIWFSDIFHNILGRINPRTGEVSYVIIPGSLVVVPVSVPNFVVFAANFGPELAIWFNEVAKNKVGRYELPANCSKDGNYNF